MTFQGAPNDVKMQKVVVIKWIATSDDRRDAQCGEVYGHLRATSMAMSMAGQAGSTSVLTAVVRTKTSKPLTLPFDVTVDKVWVLKLTGKRGSVHEYIATTLMATTLCGAGSWRNFTIESTGDGDPLDTLYEEVKHLSYDQLDDELTKAIATGKHSRTPRQHLLVSVGLRILARRKRDEEGVSSIKVLCSTPHRTWQDFINTDTLEVKWIDVNTNIVHSNPLKDWMKNGGWCDATLILMGDASRGKTTFAKCLAHMLALRMQSTANEPYYLMVGTVDSLREGQKDGLLQEHIPVVFDDLTPGLARGSRPGMSMDDIKHFTEVECGSSVNARCKDINFSANMPKFVTTNATDLHQWHQELPENLFSMSSDDISKLQPNVKAVVKRCAVCVVTLPLMDLGAREDAKRRRREKAQAVMADAFD